MYIDDQHKFLNVYNFMCAGFSQQVSEGCLERTIKTCVYAKIGWVANKIFSSNE